MKLSAHPKAAAPDCDCETDPIGCLKTMFVDMVQLQGDPEAMPLDRATVRWSEEASPPIHAATLILPAQDAAARGQSVYGETLAFNPWRTLAELAPAGSIAEARKVVYHASANLRRNVNGQPLGEPRQVRPDTVWPPARDTRIVRAAIHPGIGVARIGDSDEPDGYTIGPEVTDPPPTLTGQTRDAHGAIKRQAARFRVYGYNAAGEVVGEIDADDADIRWSVHLANKKAQWYQFQYALDLPEAKDASFPLRNKGVKGPARDGLAIDPGPRSIQGKNTSGPAYRFDSGQFMGVPVPLGELRTDEAGRLLVLGGHGKSASPTGKPVYTQSDPDTFNNADGWYDDISDGPVEASVSIAGREIPVQGSWVVVAPPNYAPDVIAWRTLYDLLVDVYVQCATRRCTRRRSASGGGPPASPNPTTDRISRRKSSCGREDPSTIRDPATSAAGWRCRGRGTPPFAAPGTRRTTILTCRRFGRPASPTKC